MPLWVRAHAGVGASGKRHGQEWWGPYDDSRFVNIRMFARIGSAHGSPRDLIWEPAGCQPIARRFKLPTRALMTLASNGCEAARVRTYRQGKRTFPVVMTPELRQHEVRVVVGHRRGSMEHLKGY